MVKQFRLCYRESEMKEIRVFLDMRFFVQQIKEDPCIFQDEHENHDDLSLENIFF
jgi:hypothetical protein